MLVNRRDPVAIVLTAPPASTRPAAPDAWLVMRACLDELPERYRAALWLADVEQLPASDVAAHLNVSLMTVTARLDRARLMLAKALCRLMRYRSTARRPGSARDG
jgi:DNA-directed RNA polymerase specialized sigma24 family protein